MPRAIALTFSCAALALGVAACGGESGSGGDADPASLVPANVPVYLESALQPQGERREDALAAAGKLLRTDDPAAKLRGLLNDALAEEGSGMTWEKDFAPWLGEDAGLWVTNLDAPEPSVAAVIATKDAEAAEATIQKLKESDEDAVFTDRTHAGVEYAVDDEGVAVGLVDDFVVLGHEAEFKRAADLREGGEVLADSDRYQNAVGEFDDDTLAHYYVDIRPLIDAGLKADPEAAQQLEQFKAFLPLDKLGPVTGAFEADGEGLALDTAFTGVPDGALRDLAELSSGSESELLGALPGDAWAAYAAPKLGESAQKTFNSFAGAIGAAAIAGQVRQATGLDLEQDVFSWVGDAGIFVRGASLAELDGALVIEATDDNRAEAAFGKLIGVIGKEAGTAPEPVQIEGAEAAFRLTPPGSDQTVVLARGEGRVVAAVGDRAAAAALDPESELSDSPLYEDASDFLGDEYNTIFLLSVGDVVKLADAMGATGAEFDRARPYLEALGTVVGGGKVDGDRLESRVGVTLK